MSDRGTTTVRTEELRERCRFLRGCVPGDELRLDCSDDRTRTVDVDERRVVSCYCCTCEATATLLLEVGESDPWEHDEKNASHVVDYWREA